MALETGARVGDYQIVGLIGAGGMGRVYRVRNIISNRDEAMKILLPDLTSERDLAVRFMMEIRTLAALEHPNIAQLRTAFQFENQLVMIMEFVEGVTLEKLATESAIPVDAVLDYSTQVLSALSFAHTHGVIHRDIKPANIMITPHRVAKLMDFGIAKNADEMHLTRPGMTIGSVYYMSPEQVRGGTIDARSDLYSFGITLYELLTGRKPFQADTSYSVLNAQLNEAPIPPIEVNPALSPQMSGIVLHALAKSPEDRFQTAQEFHDALKGLREPLAQAFVPMAAAGQGFMPVPSASAGFSATSAAFTPVSTGGPVPVPPASAAAAGGAARPAPFAPVAVAAGPANPFGVKVGAPRAKSNRGVWIGIGALVAVLAIVAIAVVLPHVYGILAKQRAGASSPDATTTASATPMPTPPTTTPAFDASAPQNPVAAPTPGGNPQPEIATPAAGQAAKPAAGATGNGNTHRPSYPGGGSSTGGSGGQAASSGGVASGGGVAPPVSNVTPAPAGPSPQEIRQTKDRLMNLEARADAARSGVQSIRSQQQAQGMDVRGDVLATMNRMNSDLREAQGAIGQGDLKAAGEYMEHADREAAALEKFLGR